MLLNKWHGNHGVWEGLQFRNIGGKTLPLLFQSCFWSVWMRKRCLWQGNCSLEEPSKKRLLKSSLTGSMTLNSPAERSQNQCWDWWLENCWRNWLSRWTQRTRILWGSKVAVCVVLFEQPNVWRSARVCKNIIMKYAKSKRYFCSM